MAATKHRYFIELLMQETAPVPRNREAEIRRAQAAHFIDLMAAWLHDEELKDKVSSMAITALGQIQITCEKDIIGRLRADDTLHIAAIRQGAALSDSLQRLAGR
ncbi:MAG: hypothetical protein P4M15_07885 [Alphaproteobacteria bacterium]|nr:hypothetical protein [Alphaproteobacteria bacterium]